MDSWSNSDKWWFSIAMGVLFFVFASAVVEALISSGFNAITGTKTCVRRKNNYHWLALLIISIFIIFIVRLALW